MTRFFVIFGDNGYIEINTRAKSLHSVALEMIDGGNSDSRGCLVRNRLVWSEVTIVIQAWIRHSTKFFTLFKQGSVLFFKPFHRPKIGEHGEKYLAQSCVKC